MLKSAERLHELGFVVKYASVDSKGFVDPDEIRKLITEKTLLVSVMHANNEIGTIEPIEEIGKICKEKGVYFHTDTVQTAAHIPINVEKMNIDLLSISSHKFYGPKGVGALYVRNGTKIIPYMDGGGHESGFRSGTLNTTGIIGLGEASRIGKEEQGKRESYIKELRDTLIQKVMEEIPAVYLNGPGDNKRLPGNVSLIIQGIINEPLLVALNERGIIAGGGSACSAGKKKPSHVLTSIGVAAGDLSSVIRMTLGKDNKKEDIDFIVESIKEITKGLRNLSPFWEEK